MVATYEPRYLYLLTDIASLDRRKTSSKFLPLLRVLQLNTEGMSRAKVDLLARVAHENNIDVVALQKMHVNAEVSFSLSTSWSKAGRGFIEGYSVVCFLLSGIHGSAVSNSIVNCLDLSAKSSVHHDVEINETPELSIISVYKPPPSSWSVTFVLLLTKSIYW